MLFEENHIYHVYNMGNNSQRIFFNDENYLFFLRKIRTELMPNSEILAYCLMPNHFHIMLQATSKSCERNKQGIFLLSRKIGNLLSSYTQAINKQRNTSGSLFRQKTKAKDLRQYITYPRVKNDYAQTCFFYIQKNPKAANLVNKAEEWKYSSYSDFRNLRNGTLCNKKLAIEILEIEESSFEFYMNGNFNDIDNIW